MKIHLAKTAGFCMGVERAMNRVMRSVAAGGCVCTLGPLIHNPQEIERLQKMGVRVVEGAGEIGDDKVVIRTHGVSPAVRESLRREGARIEDATCPRVARVQGIIKGHAVKGFHTVIVGDPGHAEVVGLLGFTAGRGHVISREEEVKTLPEMDKVCVVSQTTMDRETYVRVSQALTARFGGRCQIFDTLCDSTEQRQEEVKELCRAVDALIVVGGKNSANTARLCTIAEQMNVPAYLVETAAELDLDQLKQYGEVAVTAGASTPTWIIAQVIERLKGVGDVV
jgi:(E)-4-hydroxy-3-methyl-but-2-enyl pyrophosphate reductase